jgi:hypothetical protein
MELAMSTVELDDQEWQQVMNILSTAPWRDVNQLLLKVGSQLRLQQQTLRRGNSGEEEQHEQAH